jgi:hypothetical protein
MDALVTAGIAGIVVALVFAVIKSISLSHLLNCCRDENLALREKIAALEKSKDDEILSSQKIHLAREKELEDRLHKLESAPQCERVSDTINTVE